MGVDDQPKAEPATPPEAAADKPAGSTPAEPLKGEVSRTDSPGAGASAAPVAPPRGTPPAPKPENQSAATTATTAETSSATGAPTEEQQKIAPTTPKGAPETPAPMPVAGQGPAAPPKPAPQAAAKPAPKAEHKPAAGPPAGPPDPPPPADLPVPAFITALQSVLPDVALRLSYWVGDWTIIAPADRLLDVMRTLRDSEDSAFDFCSDVTATDWPPRAQRFDVVYALYSTRLRHRVRVKVRAADGEPVPSVTGLWPAANWLEREVYDLFGVNFTGHPDRRRILMPDEWQGHPQRKDYPLEGPGELLMESPLDWLQIRNARDTADIE